MLGWLAGAGDTAVSNQRPASLRQKSSRNYFIQKGVVQRGPQLYLMLTDELGKESKSTMWYQFWQHRAIGMKGFWRTAET